VCVLRNVCKRVCKFRLCFYVCVSVCVCMLTFYLCANHRLACVFNFFACVRVCVCVRIPLCVNTFVRVCVQAKYRERLVRQGSIEDSEAEEISENVNKILHEKYELSQKFEASDKDWLGDKWEGVHYSAYNARTLSNVALNAHTYIICNLHTHSYTHMLNFHTHMHSDFRPNPRPLQAHAVMHGSTHRTRTHLILKHTHHPRRKIVAKRCFFSC